MNQNLRKILLFMLQFVPWFLLFLVLYLVLLPKYEPIVLASANVVTENMRPPTEIEQFRGRWRAHVFTPDIGRRTLRIWNRHASHLMLLSLVTLPALLLATPAPFLVRLRMLGLALPLLFLGHVVSVIGLTRGVQCLREAPGTFHCLWMLRVVYSSGQLVAAGLWVLLTWRYWFASPSKELARAPKP